MDHIWLLDEETGMCLWHYSESNAANWLLHPVFGDDGDVYAIVSKDTLKASYGKLAAMHSTQVEGVI